MIGLFAGKLGGMNENVGMNLCQGVRGLGAFFEKIIFELNRHGPATQIDSWGNLCKF